MERPAQAGCGGGCVRLHRGRQTGNINSETKSTNVRSHPSYLIPILCRASSTNSIPFNVHSSSNDLNTYRQTSHLFSLIVLIRSLLDMVSGFEIFRQYIFHRVHFGDWDDAGWVIHKIEEEGISTGPKRVSQSIMRSCGCCIRNRQKKIQLMIQPRLKECRTIFFTTISVETVA